MTRAASCLLALVLALPCPAAPEELSPQLLEKLAALREKAGALYQKKEHRKAIDACQEILSLLPAGGEEDANRVQVHYMISLNYALLGMERDAVSHLEKAIENGLTDPRSLHRQADFDSLRNSRAFAALPQKMQRKTEVMSRRKLEALSKFDFAFQSVDGRKVQKKDFLGQVLIVDVWGTWCGPCRTEVPHFVELDKRYREKGLRIVGLNWEKTPEYKEATRLVKRFIEDFRVPYPCAVVDQEFLKTIPGFQGFPTTIFFGRDGTPRTMEVGARDLQALEEIVKPLLAEKPTSGPPKPAIAEKAESSF